MTSDTRPIINALHKRALRTFIFGTEEEWEVCAGELGEDGDDPKAYSALLAFTLGTMVRRRFSPSWTWADVIKCVAELRIRLDEQADELNPRLTENLIHFLLSEDPLENPPDISERQEKIASIQQILLYLLIDEAGLDDAGVDQLIDEAIGNTRNVDWSSVTFPRAAG
ncbi:hypothetical protein ACIBI3_25270 [Actinomadura luteofluorescens]|uniref:hypothetical protein n=1 Tax=Actinomadura luteofluorescens TaxID=46163 RepID=UPI0034873153